MAASFCRATTACPVTHSHGPWRLGGRSRNSCERVPRAREARRRIERGGEPEVSDRARLLEKSLLSVGGMWKGLAVNCRLARPWRNASKRCGTTPRTCAGSFRVSGMVSSSLPQRRPEISRSRSSDLSCGRTSWRSWTSNKSVREPIVSASIGHRRIARAATAERLRRLTYALGSSSRQWRRLVPQLARDSGFAPPTPRAGSGPPRRSAGGIAARGDDRRGDTEHDVEVGGTPPG